MFLIYCDNKGCGKTNEALLDVKTNEVFCSDCGKVITTVTSFAKTQMKALGQVKRKRDVQEAFATLCKGCGTTAQPKLEKGKVLCPKCKKEHELLPTQLHILKQFLMTNKSI